MGLSVTPGIVAPSTWKAGGLFDASLPSSPSSSFSPSSSSSFLGADPTENSEPPLGLLNSVGLFPKSPPPVVELGKRLLPLVEFPKSPPAAGAPSAGPPKRLPLEKTDEPPVAALVEVFVAGWKLKLKPEVLDVLNSDPDVP
jgi:hypothetical protein